MMTKVTFPEDWEITGFGAERMTQTATELGAAADGQGVTM
jgi:hypothetical protein